MACRSGARAQGPGRSVFGLDGLPVPAGVRRRPVAGNVHDRGRPRMEALQLHLFHEHGSEFFAEESRILLLFKAAATAWDERTLWVDDVIGHRAADHKTEAGQPGDAPSTRRSSTGWPPRVEMLVRVDARRSLRPWCRRWPACRSIAWPAGRACRTTGRVSTCSGPSWKTPVRQLRLPMTPALCRR